MISIGVNVKISGVALNPMTGSAEIEDLIILNPEGYYSEYLAKIHKVKVTLNMRKFIASKGELVEIHHMEFHNLDIIHEQGMFSSNVEYVMNFIDGMEAHEAGYLEEVGQVVGAKLGRITGAVTGIVAHTTEFVAQEARQVVDEVAPDSVQRMYSYVAHKTDEVLHDATAVAGTTVAATSAAISGATHLASDTASSAAKATSDAGGAVVAAAGDAATAASRAARRALMRRRSTMAMTTGTSSQAPGSPRRRSLSIADVRSVQDTIKEESEEQEGEQDEEPEEWLVLHRVIAKQITVRLASSAFRGEGLQLYIPDLDIEDCAEHVPADTALDMARFLMKSLLETVVQKVKQDLPFARDLADHFRKDQTQKDSS